jgi:hypothetical protein
MCENKSYQRATYQIIEFRQELHQNCLTKYRDAQFDLMDSVLSNHRVSNYPKWTFLQFQDLTFYLQFQSKGVKSWQKNLKA